VVVGTEEELWAALADDPSAGNSDGSHDELWRLVRALADDPRLPGTVVVKEGARGARVLGPGTLADVPGLPVEVLNTVGAGDAFAAGLITGWLEGSDWAAAALLANACGALVVTRHGCSTAMPTRAEVDELLGWAAHEREEAR
jgi:5-dehydro-2-deoxygluconokinase